MPTQAESMPPLPSPKEGHGQSQPGSPELESATPAQPPPGLVPQASSTAISAPLPAQTMLMHPSAIAKKWGHALVDTPDTQDTQASVVATTPLSSPTSLP